jgi:2-polyprenyl-6-hydroxyphenyl methylase/3-demethylubiquinone-9 3-methyltransferase
MGASPVDFHNRLAPAWEEKYRKGRFAARVHLLERMLPSQRIFDKDWLDAGCGTGVLSRWLAARGARIRAIDAAPAMIEQAERITADSMIRDEIHYSVADIAHPPFSSESFDGIVCSSVLEYSRDPAQCIREFARVLRPGGLLVISVPNSRSGIRIALRALYAMTRFAGHAWPKWLEHSRHQFSREGILELITECGFQPAEAESFGLAMPLQLHRNSLLGPLWMISATRTRYLA